MKSQQSYLVDGKYSFQDLLDVDRLRGMFEKFSHATGFAAGLVSCPDLELLVATGWRDICTKYHPDCPVSEIHCQGVKLDLSSWLKARKNIIKTCENGLASSAIPVVIESVQVAYLFIGQAFLSEPDVKRITRQAKKHGHDVDVYLAALAQVPIVTEEKLKKALSLFNEMTVILAEQGLKELRHRQLESRMRLSEAPLRTLVNTLPNIVWLKGPNGVYLACNHGCERLFGATEAEIVGKTDYDFVDSELADFFRERDKAAIAAGKPTMNEEEVTFADDGHRELLETIKTPLFDSEGALIGVLGIARDITERKRVEEALRDREKLLQDILTASSIGLAHAVDRKIVWANEAMHSLFAFTQEEQYLNKSTKMLYASEEEYKRVGKTIYEKQQASQVVEVDANFKRQDGSLFDGYVRVNLLDPRDPIRGIIVSIVDITARKQAEVRVRHLNQVLQSIRNVSQLITQEKDRAKLIQGSCELLVERGYRSAWLVLLDSDHKPVGSAQSGYEKEFAQLLKQFRLGQFNECGKLALQQSGVVVVEDPRSVCGGCPLLGQAPDFRAMTIRLEHQGRVFGLLSVEVLAGFAMDKEERSLFEEVAGDIAFALHNMDAEEKRRLAAKELRESQQFLQDVFDAIQDGISVLDINLNIVKTNRWMEKMYGPETPIVGKKCYQVYQQRRSPCPWCPSLRTIKTGEKHTEIVPYPSEEAPTGWIELTAYPVHDEQGNVVNVIEYVKDISDRKRAEEERKKLQEQLIQAQKMEAIGRLAGGVAHDFNNMLGVILGHTEMALEQLDPDHPLRSDLEVISKAAKRSADLTRQLLAFARRQTAAPRILDLNKTVDSMLKMLRRLIGEDISLIWNPGKKLWPVKMDPSQLDQVLANLCVNARDAIAGVGKVIIETRNATFDEASCAEHTDCVPGKYVQLSVSDNGCGMDQETIANLFEPFFTTKETGKGTGLGLSTVYGVVKQNGGFISVYSEPGMGATFKIYLPRYKDVPRLVRAEPAGKPPEGGREVILLVEDEPLILKMTTLMLTKLGYQVLPASTPGEAIRLADEHAHEIHLLMTDVVMPEMNGRDLVSTIVSAHPRLKRLFTSGYTADVVTHHGVLDEGVHFIQKPFSMTELGAKVREVLDS